MTKKTKTELKQEAQDRLLQALPVAFYTLFDDNGIPEEEKRALEEQLNKQMGRIEKMFGYAEGSWARG